ncbi:MAG: hypothetical protein IH571_01115, partial [Acholeplasmataceae bacterium]|nr:hypothetical protein [Acholeplasmataceae bacterium]
MENKLIYSIRNRSIVYLSIVFLFIIAVIFLVIRTYAVLALKDLEENNARIQMKRMENAFSFTLDAMQNNVQDWAIWDESYDYIKGTNPDYVANNLYVEAFDNLNIHHVIFFDDMGQVLNAISYDFDTMTETTVSEEMLLIIASLGIAENED